MFEHLDDPAPPPLGSRFRTRVLARGRFLRRRRRIAWTGATALATIVVATVGLYGSAFRTVDGIDRIEVAGTGSAHEAPIRTILIVGSDSGDDQSLSEAPGRTDTMIVLRVDRSSARVSVLPLPRDLAVTPPGSDESVRLNSVAENHGLSGLVGVIETELRIPIDHVMAADFAGFVRLVDLLGGIVVEIPASLRDERTGLALNGPGCVHLDGKTALQLVRSRMLSTLVEGRWMTDPTGDLGRMHRLQVVLLAALDEIGAARPGPITANRLAEWIVENVVIDDQLEWDAMVDLADLAIGLDRSNIDLGWLPVEDTILPDHAVVLSLGDGAEKVIEDFTDEGAVTPNTSENQIDVCS